MFFGEYEYTIDQKGRVNIPPKFRDSFKEGMILSRGYDKCIVVYTVSEWEKKADELAGLSMTRSKARRLNRATFSSTFSLDIDNQGRVMLPAPLREYAGITGEVVIAGVRNYLEIWSKEEWVAEQEAMTEQVWQIVESIEEHK